MKIFGIALMRLFFTLQSTYVKFCLNSVSVFRDVVYLKMMMHDKHTTLENGQKPITMNVYLTQSILRSSELNK